LPGGVEKTGPLGPFAFLRTLTDSQVVLWDRKEQKNDDGSKVITFSPRSVSGEQVLSPGNHPIFRGIHSKGLTDRLEFISLMLALFGGTASLPTS